MTLPDCPNGCDASDTLTPLRADVGGAIWAVCSCCAKECLIRDGRVVHPLPSKVDVSGREMFDP